MLNGTTFLIIPLVVGCATMLLALIPDVFNLLAKQARMVFFVMALVLFVPTFSFANIDFSPVTNISRVPVQNIAGIWQSQETIEKKTRLAISKCRAFVTSNIEGRRPGSNEPEDRPGIIKASFSEDTMWEYCAEQFGVNYWKYDTTINGRKGGEVLCEAYSKSGYVSGKVNSWCNTVFSPKDNNSR